MVAIFLLALQYIIFLGFSWWFWDRTVFWFFDLLVFLLFAIQTLLIFGRIYFLVLWAKTSEMEKMSKEYEQINLLEKWIIITSVFILVINGLLYGVSWLFDK